MSVLSEYVGFSDWADFKNKHKEEIPISKNERLIPDEFGITLFNICLKNHHFKTALEYLELLPSYEIDEISRYKVQTSLGTIIRKDKKAQLTLVPALAKTKNGRFYFYESFVDIDYINCYYKNAITEHYTPYINVNNRKKYITDFVFVKSIEFIAHLKANKKKDAIKTSYSLFQKINVNIDFNEFSHPYPYARLIVVYLISEYLKNKLTFNKVDFCVNKITNLIEFGKEHSTFFILQIIIGLNFCGYYNEVIELYNKYQSIIDNPLDKYHQPAIIRCVNNSLGKLGFNIKKISLYPDYPALEKQFSIKSNTPLL